MILIEVIIMSIVSFIIYFIQHHCIVEKDLTLKGMNIYRLFLLINGVLMSAIFLTLIAFLVITVAIFG